MRKALTVFIILNLVFGAVITYLGFQSFSQRTMLKGQSVELENAVQALVDTLKWGDEVAWEEEEDRRQEAFSLIQPGSSDDLRAFERNLSDLSRFASQRMAQVNQRHSELVSNRRELADAQTSLANRERELASAQRQEERLKETREEVESTLSDVRSVVSELNQDKSELESRIARLTTQVQEREVNIASLEIDIESRTQQRDMATMEYERIRRGAMGMGDQDPGVADLRGLRGRILAVNPDWQYVVIDKGLIDNIQTDIEAHVHRAGEFVAKIKVTEVEDEMAIAEIVPGTISNAGVQPGDQMFF